MEKLAVSWNVSQMDVVHCTSPLLAQRGSKRAETQSENSCYLAAASRQLGHRRKDRVMEVVKAKTQAKDAEMGPHQGSSLVAPTMAIRKLGLTRRGGMGKLKNYPPPPCASTAAVPEVRPKRWFNAHPVLRQGRAYA